MTKKTFKIAVIASSTFDHIQKSLSVECSKQGIDAQFYVGKYGQYAQETLDNSSGLYNFSPNLTIIFIDTRAFFGDQFFVPYKMLDEERMADIRNKEAQLKKMIQVVLKNTSGKIILHNFEVPIYSPLGILENKQKFGFIESIQNLNRNLQDFYKSHNRVFVFDYDAFCSKLGKKGAIDPRLYYLADIKLDFKYFADLSHEYMAYVKPMLSLSKKCLVLDLDNTLWGGVVGEDGLEGIKLGPTPSGRPFLEFQKHILSLFNRGVILAISSKNNPEDALRVLREHPHMVLKEDNFAAIKINWTDKVSNLKEIAKELNIGIDSMAFVDDDVTNREMVKRLLPEVEVVELPEDPALYSSALAAVNSFNTLQITKEDKARGMMYVANRKRQVLQNATTDLSDFLKSLNIRTAILDADSFAIPRISQLTQKTNQFNLTTKRYLENNIEDFVKSGEYIVKYVKVEDQFGDYGITGVKIIKKSKDAWLVDNLLLSCRVLGKNIEFAIMAGIIEDAKKEKVKTIIGHFIPTKKNAPAKDFYKNCLFTCIDKKPNLEVWSFDVENKNYPYPKFVKIA